ncbi:MAG: phosphotyrosine protein phosphatase [Betaproteobacteria bacterium SG8_39]|nr:MAG: phosphotyrosine protein phosphatase [Betaproteobacteria bacterium SG8_39]
MKTSGVLFVCTGNICRSPTAHGVFLQMVRTAGLAQQLRVDSAGTHDYHVGEPPDARAQAHARRRGYDLSALRARQVSRADFDAFDRILAMDRGHLKILRQHAPPGYAGLGLLMDYAQRTPGPDVPDPYYGGADGFERVLDMIEHAAAGLLRSLEREGRN